MFILETNSNPLRKWSKLMFVLFLVTGMFGPLFTMHLRVMPRQTKMGLEQAAKHNIGGQVKSGGAVMARTVAIWIFGLLASAFIGGMVGARLQPPYSYDWEIPGALAGMFTFACLRLWLAAPSKPER
jgi:heme/copper-type cytochrome/quinol oxidase subunit 1